MGREKVYAIQLFRDADREQYCGCWHVPSWDNDPARARLHAAGFGCGLMEDGTVVRSFFFGEEIEAQLDKAHAVTECFVEWDEVRLGGPVA